MDPTKLYIRRIAFLLVGTAVLVSGCKDVMDENSFFTDQIPSTGILETKPQNYPEGFGVDFETDSIVSLDEYPNFKYDLKMLAWRIQDPVTGAYGGRPVVFLWGNTATPTRAMALNVSEFAGIQPGPEGFAGFKYVTKAMEDNLKADNTLPIDPNDTVLYPWKDGFIQMSEATLLSAYQSLVIGDKVVRLAESVSPVWLIRTSDGNYFKWQHIERQGGGHVPIRWYRFKAFEVN
ncbi:MAG: hypothetical protein QM800_09530 [Paludibacter sp.]